MTTETCLVTIKELEDLIERRLSQLQYNSEEISVIKQILLYSQLVEGTQGVLKLVKEGVGCITKPNPAKCAPKVIFDQGVVIRVDGGENLGMLALNFACEKAIGRANSVGMAVVGLFHSFGSTGALGYYAEKIASQGLVAVLSSGSSPTVAAHGSADRNFGTNPLAYAIPGAEEPLVVYDASTSAMSFWGLKEYEANGKQLDEDVALDKEGRPTRDPSFAAVLRTFGGVKGSGLSLFLEFLTGPLVGATSARGELNNWGSIVFVFKPDLFQLGSEEVQKNTMEMIHRIKSSRPREGFSQVFLPGEKSSSKRKQRLQQGQLPISKTLIDSLRLLVNSSEQF
eukprot:jgi/Galph1/2212/GphlegSOOS_G912.1